MRSLADLFHNLAGPLDAMLDWLEKHHLAWIIPLALPIAVLAMSGLALLLYQFGVR